MRRLRCAPHSELSSREEDLILLVGLVDVLQLYNFGKRSERWYKIRLRGNDAEGVSVASPREYCRRFVTRVGALFHDIDGGGADVETGAADEEDSAETQAQAQRRLLRSSRRRPRPKSESAILLG